MPDSLLYRTLFAAYPDALIVVDAQGRIVAANPAASALLGYTGEEFAALGVEDLVPDAIRPRHAAWRENYAGNPRPRPMGTQMELVARRKDGTEVMVEIALSPLQSAGLPLVVAAIRDIGAYPRVRQALQRAAYNEHVAQLGRLAVDSRDPQVLLRRLPGVAAQAMQAEAAVVFLLEPGGSEFRVAGGVGLVPGEGVGQRVPNRRDTPPGFVVAMGQPLRVDDYRSETRFSVPGTYLEAGLVSALAVPLSDRGRPIGALTVRSSQLRRFGDDEVRFLQALSNLLASSLQRAESEEALNHAARLESVGQLTGGIAHDFNNLLTVIQGNLQVLEDLPALAGDETAQPLLAAAQRASRRGAELTAKLLAFSRRQVLQPTPVDVPALLHALADMLRRTIDQRIAIALDVADDCPPVMADPGQLESALLNIAINARDAMPEGGTLRFTARPLAQTPAEPRQRSAEAAAPLAQPCVAIAVADTGLGMSDEVRERAIEPFFTTKEAGRGTGLGLSTVYGFVKQSRGAMDIDSAPGAGTTVTLYIPQPRRAPASPQAASTGAHAGHEHQSVGASDQVPADGAAAAPPVPAGLKVLLVEDDAEVRAVGQRFLAALGCEVHTAASAEQALPLLERDAERPFQLLVSDIALGAGMRGTTLATQAQALRPALAVLLVSGFSEELLRADAESPPGWELLRKPYSREELTRAVQSALASSGGAGATGPATT
jgi:PAS domain S-box-containing protein